MWQIEFYETEAGRSRLDRIIYFAAPGRKFVLLNGFTKKRRETPPKEMATAFRRMRAYNEQAKG